MSFQNEFEQSQDSTCEDENIDGLMITRENELVEERESSGGM